MVQGVAVWSLPCAAGGLAETAPARTGQSAFCRPGPQPGAPPQWTESRCIRWAAEVGMTLPPPRALSRGLSWAHGWMSRGGVMQDVQRCANAPDQSQPDRCRRHVAGLDRMLCADSRLGGPAGCLRRHWRNGQNRQHHGECSGAVRALGLACGDGARLIKCFAKTAVPAVFCFSIPGTM